MCGNSVCKISHGNLLQNVAGCVLLSSNDACFDFVKKNYTTQLDPKATLKLADSLCLLWT